MKKLVLVTVFLTTLSACGRPNEKFDITQSPGCYFKNSLWVNCIHDEVPKCSGENMFYVCPPEGYVGWENCKCEYKAPKPSYGGPGLF